MKTIGIVAEGPRDYELIAAVIDTITNEENSYQKASILNDWRYRDFYIRYQEYVERWRP